MSRELLIDGDILVYRFANANEHWKHWDWDVWSRWADPKQARQCVDTWLDAYRDRLEADGLTVVLSDSDENWRKEVMPTYKSNRTAAERPCLYKTLREHLIESYGAETEPRLEGDDLLGLLADGGYDAGQEMIMCTIDKDLKTVPGLHHNWDHEGDEITVIDDVEAHYNWMFQTLTGDSTDGYKGAKNIGPVKAERLLLYQEDEDLWGLVVDTFVKSGLTEQDALMNARVARILRGNDYNWEQQMVRLWTPGDGR